MKCLNSKCDATYIEIDDNFCYKCGHITAKGYSFLKSKDNINHIIKGNTFKQKRRLFILFYVCGILFISFNIMLIFRGNDLFRPIYYLRKRVLNYVYGYNTSLVLSNKTYNKVDVNSYMEAIKLIKKDSDEQNIYCIYNQDVRLMTYDIEKKYLIPSVSLCDISVDKMKELKGVIDRLYSLFSINNNALTNISLVNTNENYIASFKPMYQFINSNESINTYNKVNKSQILLNSYYFLNDDKSNNIDLNYYVKDASLMSLVAHEFGHYISFLTILKKYNVDNITFETKDNYKLINTIIDEFNSGSNSYNILVEALNNYNTLYNSNYSLEEFSSFISKYAGEKDKDNNLIYDEVIAEAIHDYYLHGDNLSLCSKEIINVIKSRL